jgi:alpha-glucosidase (family GH31 glycosyl hydrolase)
MIKDSDDLTWYQTFADQSKINTYNLPFIPGQFNLDNMSISLNATHPESGQTQFNTHSLNGHMEAKATYEYLMSNDSVHQGKRTFLLSRSTFSGSGQYT